MLYSNPVRLQKILQKSFGIYKILYIFEKRGIYRCLRPLLTESANLTFNSNRSMIDIGALMKRCREFSILTQQELVKLVKIPLTQPELSAIESGKRPKVSFEKVSAMLEAMGLEILIHEGIVVNEPSDVVKLRKEFRKTLKEIAPHVDVCLKTLETQEREGGMRLTTFLQYLKYLGLKIVLIDDGIDINEYKTGNTNEHE